MSQKVCEEGFYWVILGQNPPEIAYWERGEWWLAGDARPPKRTRTERSSRGAIARYHPMGF